MKKAATEIDRHVGSRIRLRRMMLKMSQERLATSLGITFQQVQKYEKGTNRVGASRLQHIAKMLDVSVDYLFAGAPGGGDGQAVGGFGEPSAPAYDIDLLTPEGIRLLRAFQSVADPRIRKRVVDLVEALHKGDKAD